MAINNDTVQIIFDENLKHSAEKVLQSIGLELSEEIRLLYQQIVIRGEFSLELRLPNQKTIDAMNAEPEAQIYESADGLFKNLIHNGDE